MPTRQAPASHTSCPEAAAAGRHVFVVCNGERCQRAGASGLLGLLQQVYVRLRDDQDLRVSSSRCLGHCAMAPAMVEDGRMLGWVSLRRLHGELLRLGVVNTPGISR
jgi:NADH:ubiquinone oxidoreductase subunit E